MSLDLDQLSALFDLLAAKDIAEFEHEEGGVRLRVARGAKGTHVTAAAMAAGQALVEAGAAPGPSAGAPPSTDYPDAPPFVQVGSVVRPGQTLCIIEAMKLMNEIEAECSGTVTEVFAQNGKSVEYGQKLFRIKKA